MADVAGATYHYGMSEFFTPAPEEHMVRQKNKARELRRSQWWKNRLGEGNCYYCERRFQPSELTMDHVVPIVRGGSSARSNVVPCCKECNTRKRDCLPVEWDEYLNRIRET